MASINWTAVGAIANVALAVLTLCVLVVYYWTLNALQDSVNAAVAANKSQNLLNLLATLSSDSVRKARGEVYKLQGKGIKDWPDGAEDHAATVCSTFNSAELFMRNMSDEQRALVLEVWGTTISRCYHICQDLIKKRRESDHERFWKQFEDLNNAVPDAVKWKANSQGQ